MGTEGSSSGEIDSLLGERPFICRSGSAPPTVEGSRAAARSFFGIAAGEDEMRSDPKPALSREHWRVAQRLGLDSDSDSLFSFQPPTCNGGRVFAKTGTDGLIGSRDVGVGERKKSFADVLQQDLGSATSTSGHLSRPVSHNAFDKICDPMESSDVRSFGSTSSQSFASNSGFSLARSKTTYPQLISRSSNPNLPLMVGSASDTDKIFVSNVFDDVTPCNDTTISLSGLKLSDKIIEGQNHVEQQYPRESHDIPGYEQYIWQNNRNMAENESSVTSIPLQAYREISKKTDSLRDVGLSTSSLNEQPNLSRLLSTDFYRKLQTGINSYTRSSDRQTAITNAAFAGCHTNPCSGNQGIPIAYKKQPNAADDMGGEYGNRTASLVGSGFQIPFVDQHYARYQPRACNLSNASLSDPSLGRYYSDTSLVDIPGYQEACLQAYLAQRNYHYDESLGKYGSFYNGLCGDLGMRYPSHLSGSLLSSLALRNPVRQNEHFSRLRSIYRSASGVSKEPWNHESIIAEDGFLSLLEELKNNKTRSFELSEIVGHVVEFSTDQYGSRFIQQKLETASVEEKNKIFPEILPCARELMVDVFGNYVIQKFFELGTKSQKNQLVDQLIGYVLHLSLQMYGCRVIQKALQVVDVEQQIQMVSEFGGSVMKCVRDQNGNHVIQKCIECVPQERIQFIKSSFYGQVVSLSTHPYGCRVIQRILEHCDDIETQTIMINEILHSVCSLAQDQYGNYVVQHVLQHGKQEERSAIIKKLTGEIVKMSQQKFASNVVEKCLTYCNSEERQNIITEMLGSTDENEPLQAMMKDQFGNYVVQKVLETCDDRNRELILSRIKLHLNALKKYTYGKHIVSRAEKLITGERRIVGL